jgi:CBS domain-containing protein
MLFLLRSRQDSFFNWLSREVERTKFPQLLTGDREAFDLIFCPIVENVKRGADMPHSMPVSKLMTRLSEWPQLKHDTDVRSAIKILRIVSEDEKLEHGHSTPLVFDDNYKLLGFVHLTDLLKNIRHLCDKAPKPCELGRATTPISELVVPFTGTVVPGDSILKALDIMMDHSVTLVPLMKGDRVEGLIKLSDIFNTVAALLFDERDPDERRRLLRDFQV